jgi:hypothetical protein
MKSRNKLVTMFSLILVSAAIVGTASYAWFTMNDNVDTTGLDIQAVAAKNLIICETSDGAYSTTDDLSDGTKTLFPCSTTNCTNWYTPETTEGIDFGTGTISGSTPFKAISDTTGYVRVGTVYIKAEMKAEETAYSKLYVSGITVNRGTEESDLTKALRIGVVCNGTVRIFDYDSLNSSVTTSAVASIGADKHATTSAVSSAIVNTSDGANSALITTNVGSTPVQVDIYIWYEGQDDACTAHNSIQTENVVISMEFKAE